MDITPEEEEVNPLVVTFEKLNTQLEKLAERDRRAEERERNALEREQALIERQSKLNQAMNNIAIKSGNFQSSVIDTETRLKTFLLDYIKDFPNSTGIIEAIAKEIKRVNQVFDQKSLMAGVGLLLKIMRQFKGVYEGKEFYLVKNGQVGWISAYVNQQTGK